MGQNNSTPSPAPPNNQDTEPSSSSAEPNSSSINVAPVGKQSRRARLRKSISKLIKPSTPQSLRSRADDVNTYTRNSWRNSHRWSKGPPDLNHIAESSPSTGPSSDPSSSEKGKGIERELEADAGEPSRKVGNVSSTSSLSDGDNDLEDKGVSRVEEDVTQNLATSEHGRQEDSQVSSALEPRASTYTQSLQNEDEDDTFANSNSATQTGAITEAAPITEEGEHMVNALPEPSSGPPLSLPPTPRQFPPAGTLVVVQGVVQTSDAPQTFAGIRRRASSMPRPSTPIRSARSNGARNRLSALLRNRPTSLITPQSSTSPSAVDSPSSQTDISSSSSSEALAPGITATITPASSSDAVDSDLPNPDSSVQAPVSSNSFHPGSISPSSIEVLGTLLSVAAAATAASLRTGASEPATPSGINSPFFESNDLSAAPSTDLSVDVSDTSSHPASPSTIDGSEINPDNSAPGRSRQTWGNIRDRLGLRSTNQTSVSGTPNMVNNELPGAEATSRSSLRPPALPLGARELMLAEMARAFNLGLGAHGTFPEGVVPGSSSNGSEAAADAPLPAEGSFERFLIDLQADLRTAFTLEAVTDGNGNPEVQPSASDGTSGSETPRTINNMAGAHSQPGAASEGRVPSHVGSAEGQNLSVQGENVLTADSDANSRNGLGSADGHQSASSFVTANGEPDNRTNESSASEAENNSGRINWWRLYRFPPIVANPSQHSPTTAPPAATPSPQSPLQESSASWMPNMTTDRSQSGTLPASTEDQPNMVIPIIVVGLQSVDMNWQHDNESTNPTGENEPFAAEGIQEGEVDDINDATPRGQGWQSRAVNALRNLRPGRRPDSRNAQAATGTSLRTFLVYVIGGYYPPDHNIVTGGPHNLDSLEALLELAEFLGQVKPPTVSKEEIEKSGLETIKPAQLEQYEKEGKISSNCVDRCLICLDDYEPTEDIRVLTCRHAFHMTCVDKWLQTGRNNCPACRSTGVSTDIPS